MKKTVEELTVELEQKVQELEQLKQELENAKVSCEHQWGEPKLEYREECGLAKSNWPFPGFYCGSTKSVFVGWSRKCSLCGKVERTVKSKEVPIFE